MNLNIPTIVTKINSNLFDKKEVQLFIKRDDLIHEIISGNKWRKLKYNFQKAKKEGYDTILSFGGAYSNHLHALSYAANQNGFKSIGIVRGEKNKILNNTLSFCVEQNMKLYYLDRERYKYNKYSEKILNDFRNIFGSFYLIPEGGNNILGVKGCEEIVQELNFSFDYLCSAVGTGCTASGLIRAINNKQNFLGFCPFKKTHEQKNIIMNHCNPELFKNWDLIPDNHFGGFGRINSNLIKFVRQFYLEFNIKLDLIYMGKLFYSLFNLIENDFFSKKTKIVILHTGGIQGVNGFSFNY